MAVSQTRMRSHLWLVPVGTFVGSLSFGAKQTAKPSMQRSGLLSFAPLEIAAVNPHAMQDRRQFARHSYRGFLPARLTGDLDPPRLQRTPALDRVSRTLAAS
jgi:hypothetical protein